MNFLKQLGKETNKIFTRNAAVTNKSTLNAVLDFFALAGAMRDRENDAVRLFQKAYLENPLLALRALFYLRDIRGGQGERNLFRKCLKVLDEKTQEKLLPFIPEYGRFDDIFALPIEKLIPFIEKQLKEDEENMKKGDAVSLLAKWMPSLNTSSEKTVRMAEKLRKKMKMTPRAYRKRLSALRKYIILLEQKMSSNDWKEINYEKVPSQAMRKHIKAFKRNDEDRFDEYLEDVSKGKKKIKTSTLYTYEVFETLFSDEKTANVLWENLPDYTDGREALVVADVSGSMSGRPMSVSVSLALYFAERNKGALRNYFMTFSASPQLVKVMGKTLKEKINFIQRSDWGYNTNLNKTFEVLLKAAKKSKVKENELPKVLYIISDMEFDECCEVDTNFEAAKKMYAKEGYVLPHIVFWNVNSLQDQLPALAEDGNVTLISGASQAAFRYAVEGKSPEELMMEILNSQRYSQIEI